MNLLPFLKANQVILGLAGNNLNDIMKSLVQPLVVNGIVTDEAAFIADLLQREHQVTTAMEGGIAFPHARSHGVKKLGLVIGITADEGITYNPQGSDTVRLFFCIAIPATTPNSHIPLLSMLARFSRDPKRLEKLYSYKTPAGVVNFIASYKEK